MAATLSQSAFGLQAPTNDDTMEISSDFGAMDGDIDIDLDSAGETMHYEDDDQMIDDVNADRTNYHDDDVMLDGDTASNAGDREMQMQDDAPPAQENDEELLDFSEDEDIYADDAPPPEQPPTQAHELSVEYPAPAPAPVVEEPVEQVQSEAAAELVTEGVDVVDHTAQQDENEQAPQITTLPDDKEQSTSFQEEQLFDINENDPVDPATVDATVHASETEAAQSQDTVHGSTEAEQAQPEVTESIELSAAPLDQTSQHETEVPVDESTYEEHAEVSDETHTGLDVPNTEPDQPAVQPAPLTVDTEVARNGETDAASSRADRPNSPTVTGLHPTVVEWDKNELYLFPLREPAGDEQYLLGNENLVTTSLGDLLQACRSVLGHSLSEDDELVLGVEELGLYVSEDSTPAFSTSFSELLDVYLKLHKHDGEDHPPPFRVTLTTKTRFTNRLTLITQAIAEGKGFSQLPFVHEPEYDDTTVYEDIAGFPDEDDFDDDDDFHEDTEYYAAGEEQQQPQQDQKHQDHSTDDKTDNHPAEESADHQQGDEHSAQESEDQHELHPAEGQDDNGNTDENQVSYEANQDQEYTEVAQSLESSEHTEEHAPAEEAQDESQYYDADGQSYEQAHGDDQSGQTYEEANGDDQSGDPSQTVAQETATDPYESVEGNLDGSQHDDSLTNEAALDEDAAQATHDVDETPAYPEGGEEPFADVEAPVDETEGDAEASAEDGQDQPDNTALEEDIFDDSEIQADVVDAGETEGHNPQGLSTAAAEKTASSGHDGGPLEADNEIDLGEELNGDDATEGNDLLEVEGADGQDQGHTNAAVDGNGVTPEHDPDVIDFDDDEGFEDEPATPSKENVQAATSPSIKRSYSERNEGAEADEDDQALKKARSS